MIIEHKGRKLFDTFFTGLRHYYYGYGRHFTSCAFGASGSEEVPFNLLKVSINTYFLPISLLMIYDADRMTTAA